MSDSVSPQLEERIETPMNGDKGHVEQLQQLLITTWDGDLICKAYRDDLVKGGLAARAMGFNHITGDGIRWLAQHGKMPENPEKFFSGKDRRLLT